MNHQQLLLEDIVVYLVKEEHQETTIITYHKIIFTLKNQGLDKPIYGSTFALVIELPEDVCFSHLHSSLVINCVSNIEIILPMSLECCDVTVNDSNDVKWQCQYLYMTDI